MLDELFRILGIQKILIIYFSYGDKPAVDVLLKKFGIQAKALYVIPTANTLPPEVNKYPIVIIIGPRDNPIISRFIKMHSLPRRDNYIGIVGNMIFIVSSSPAKTYELVSQWIQSQ